MYLNSDVLNVRRGPSANNKIPELLLKNTRVEIVSGSGQWVKIRSGNV